MSLTSPPPQLSSPVHRALVLAPDPVSVRRARQLIKDMCETVGVDEDICGSAVLLTSELVTNAFAHGRSEARLQVQAKADVMVVEVADDNSRHPERVAPDPQALDGRGLEIVQLVAARWGVRDDAFGKTVWFEVRAAT